jgi:cytochrome P450
MSAYYILMDPIIFKNPHEFRPERWLGPEARDIEPFFVPFSRGSRACLGQNLAWAEVYIVFATIMRRFPNLKLHNTKPEDVAIEHDFFAGAQKWKEGDMGMQVKG